MLEIGYNTRDGLLRIVDVSQSREGAPVRVTIAENIGMKSFRELGERGRVNMLARSRKLAKLSTGWPVCRARVVREFASSCQSLVTVEVSPNPHRGVYGFGYCIECGKTPAILSESCKGAW